MLCAVCCVLCWHTHSLPHPSDHKSCQSRTTGAQYAHTHTTRPVVLPAAPLPLPRHTAPSTSSAPLPTSDRIARLVESVIVGGQHAHQSGYIGTGRCALRSPLQSCGGFPSCPSPPCPRPCRQVSPPQFAGRVREAEFLGWRAATFGRVCGIPGHLHKDWNPTSALASIRGGECSIHVERTLAASAPASGCAAGHFKRAQATGPHGTTVPSSQRRG